MTDPLSGDGVAVDDRDPIESIEQSFSTLFRFVKSLARESAAQVAPGLPPAAWTVLRQLVRESPVQVGALVTATGMDKSSVSRHLRDLRERGLVETSHSADDARAVMVRPTARATEDVEAVVADAKQRYRRFLDTWSEDELREFAASLERLAQVERFAGTEA